MGSKQRFNFTIQVDDVDEGTSECVVLQIHYHKQKFWNRTAKQFILNVKKGARIVLGAMEGASQSLGRPEHPEPPELPEASKHSEPPELPETPKRSEPPENPKSPYLCWEGFHRHTPDIDSEGAECLFM